MRITHWVNLVCMALLILSGFLIHFPFWAALTGVARGLHVFCGIVLLVNCIVRIVLAFLCTSAPTGGTRNKVRDYKTWLPQDDNKHQLGAWIKYYLFMKKDHPLSAKLGVPQKISYLAVAFLILIMAYTGFCLWIPTSEWTFFAAGTSFVGGAMSMRIIHYFMMFVFIIFTIEDVKRALCCADNKATKLMRELEKIGLIERKRRGLGRPSLVYVKNFSAESSNSRFKNRENHESGGFKTTSQDPAKSRCNKTDENNTEMSETYPFHSEEADGMNKREQLEEYFSQSLEVDTLLRLCPDDEDTIYQIVDLLVDTCATNRKMLRIAGDDKPAEVVRSRFMKLNADHIRFVLTCLAENSSPIRNMKQYLLASLYNAPTTMQLTYQNRTNHDFAHGSPRG